MDIRGRLGTRYEDYLTQGAADAGDPAEELTGHSGYFTKPGVGYDPRLFSGEKIKSAVRKTVLGQLYGFWKPLYDDPEAWSTVWFAGSGVSHQWNAERGGVGDLDVLIGVNFRKFLYLNPEFRGVPEDMIATRFNQELHDRLWPSTADYRFAADEEPFEITYFVNPGSEDIRDINPYAAYNVTSNDWTVRPVELPDNWDPRSYFPAGWWQMADQKMASGKRLVEHYRAQSAQVTGMSAGSPGWVNATAALRHTAEAATGLFDEIHIGRKAAFAGGGQGYFGPENCLWQLGKLTGVIDALRKIRSVHTGAVRDAQVATYGHELTDTAEAHTTASLWGTKYQGV